MALIVQKYGGTSMGNITRIKNVAQRVKRWYDNGHQVVVVVSAMSGETNRLIGLAREISSDPTLVNMIRWSVQVNKFPSLCLPWHCNHLVLMPNR